MSVQLVFKEIAGLESFNFHYILLSLLKLFKCFEKSVLFILQIYDKSIFYNQDT